MLSITVKGELVHLLPQRALYRPKHRTLYVADLLWRTPAAHDELRRLTAALKSVGARRLVILGGLVSTPELEPAVITAVEKWRAVDPALHIDLVASDHAQSLDALPASWHMHTLPPLFDDAGFVLSHVPAPDAEGFVLCGALNPTWKMYGRGKQEMILPSFVQTARMLVFPAFSHFMSTPRYRFDDLEHVYGVTDQHVIQIL